MKITGLETLVFWGHGVPSAFCSLEWTHLSNVATWKKQNSGFALLKCSRATAGIRGRASILHQKVVKNAATKRNTPIQNSNALPIAETKSGKTSDYSILKWHPGSATWAYVGAPGEDKNMFAACFKLEDFMPPRGDQVGYVRALAALQAFKSMTATHPFAVKYKYGQDRVDKYNLELASVKNNAYIIAGTIGMLRWCLTEIN